MKLTRRELGLAALGAATTARAQMTRPAASRLIVFFTPNGTVPARWRPTGTETAFSFGAGTVLEPLTALRDKLVVIDELDFFKQAGNSRVSFTIVSMPKADVDRFEDAIYDCVLSRYAR